MLGTLSFLGRMGQDELLGSAARETPLSFWAVPRDSRQAATPSPPSQAPAGRPGAWGREGGGAGERGAQGPQEEGGAGRGAPCPWLPGVCHDEAVLLERGTNRFSPNFFQGQSGDGSDQEFHSRQSGARLNAEKTGAAAGPGPHSQPAPPPEHPDAPLGP